MIHIPPRQSTEELLSVTAYFQDICFLKIAAVPASAGTAVEFLKDKSGKKGSMMIRNFSLLVFAMYFAICFKLDASDGPFCQGSHSGLIMEASFPEIGRTSKLFPNPEKKFLLITGCARSGTGYISRLLTHSGLAIGHETPFQFGLSSWPMAVDSDHSAWGPPSNAFVFEHVFHQVRDPVKVITSVYSTEKERSWSFICQEIPEIKMDDPNLVRCAKYWIYWNLSAEKKAEWTYRVEDIDLIFDEYCARLGVSLNRSGLTFIPRNANTRAHDREFTWADFRRELPFDLLCLLEETAIRYGYSIED